MAGPKKLSARLYSTYNERGFLPLLKSAPKTAISTVASASREVATRAIYSGVSDKMVSRSDISRGCDSTWTYAECERVDIGGSVERELPEAFEACLEEYERPAPFLAEFGNARLLWNGSVCLTRDGEPILETAENERVHLRNRIRDAVRSRGVREVWSDLQGYVEPRFSSSSPLFLLVRHSATNYYHWVAEYLPKLAALDEFESQNAESATILIEAEPPKWVVESLKMMGYESTDWVTWGNESAQVERLLVPQHRARTPGTPPLPSPEDYHYVRRSVLKQKPNEDFVKRLFISRQDADDRRIKNRDAVEQALAPLGFEKYVPGEMRFEEQAALFSEAECVVAPHGAGLTNLLFSHSPTVIELFQRDQIRNHYFYLSQVLGHDYHYLENEPSGVDMVVDVESLLALVESVVGTDQQ